jgi:hypothetical protein
MSEEKSKCEEEAWQKSGCTQDWRSISFGICLALAEF